MSKRFIILFLLLLSITAKAQFNTDRLLTIGRSALYYEDYVLSIQYFNKVIAVRPYLYEPWFFRAVAKYNLDDFIGAEADCTAAIERNPYVVNVYELRGLTRIMQKKYAEAISDYDKALRYSPENKSLWHNKVLCKINGKDYDGAHNDLDTLLNKWSTYAKGYSMRGEVYIFQKDTTAALQAFDRAMEIDPYDASIWAAKAIVSLARSEWGRSDTLLTEAIRLQPKQSGFYVNRALARVNRNNYRGAMSDYDLALEIDPNNFLGHYNRGLLRAQVGDDNRAITDFDFVLKLEPDNYTALYNRALLLEKTGDLKGAIRDYTTVIDEYPSFWAGLQNRAACYRKLGMTALAEKDEFKIYKEQLYKRLYGTVPRLDKKKQRKRSDNDPDKYNQLVVADEQELEHEYSSEYRGKVQNRKADMELQPMYALSLERASDDLRTAVVYDNHVEEHNSEVGNGRTLYIENTSKSLDEKQTAGYFERIERLSLEMGNLKDSSSITPLLVERAVAYAMINDYENTKADMTTLIQRDSTCSLAYWQRAVAQSRINEFDASLGTDVAMKTANVLSDLTDAIKYNPSAAHLYYNRGNVYALRNDLVHAMEDYKQAIKLDDRFAAAYYNCGIAKIKTGDVNAGIVDLGKAGELGLYSAYSVIKKYSKK